VRYSVYFPKFFGTKQGLVFSEQIIETQCRKPFQITMQQIQETIRFRSRNNRPGRNNQIETASTRTRSQAQQEGREKGQRGTNLSGEVLEDGGEVDGGAGADALGVLAGLEEPGNPADGKLEPGLGAPRRRLLRGASADRLATARHLSSRPDDDDDETACAGGID